MSNTKPKRAFRVATESAVALDELQWGLALPQACMLQRRPLIKPGRNQDGTTEYRAPTFHHWRKQRGALNRPLRQGGDNCERRPSQEIAAEEPIAISKG